MARREKKKKLAKSNPQKPASAMVEVLALRELIRPVIQQVQMPQRGEDDVVKEGRVRR